MATHPMAEKAPAGRDPALPRRERSAALGRYFLLSYLAVLVNLTFCLEQARWGSLAGSGWLLVVYLTYGAFYLLPVFGALALLNRLSSLLPVARVLRRPLPLLAVLAWLGTSAVQILLHTDAVLFDMYGFHLNGFVWNLLTTEGGIESLGASASTEWTFALLGSGFVLLQGVLLLIALRAGWWRRVFDRRLARPAWLGLVLALPLLSAGERLAFSISEQTGYRPVVDDSNVFPFYMALHWTALGEALGLPEARDRRLDLAGDRETASLNYPLAPLQQVDPAPRPNIVWLVSESFRADMLDDEIMPETMDFAARSTRFRDHHSGGDGTRMGMFSMFYGLPGSYWFSFLAEQRGPVLMDQVIDGGYQVELFTSARFSYPEFSRTLFARVPSTHMHERVEGLPGWKNDRLHVDEMLRFLDARDQARPFMMFMFFESPHARYYFPPESVIRRPYLEDFNYASMDPERDMPLVRNRYINSCHHLDSQLGRVFAGLEQRGLLDSTLVIVTGDHGEEFMERGRWGHNSAFTEPQTRVPLVIHVPGREPAVVDRLTSHLDLPATVLARLGVTNPAQDYSLGHDLFGPERRQDCLVADWDGVGLLDAEAKIVVPLRQGHLAAPEVTSADDRPLTDEQADAVLSSHRARLLQLLDELSRFRR